MVKNGHAVFFKEGLADLRTVGTLVCTSRFVAKVMTPEIVESDPPKVIVEFGVGIGSITKEIVKCLRPQDFFVGIDSNEKFIELCRQNIAYSSGGRSVHIQHGFAQDIDKILTIHHRHEADEVVCTLPFRVLPKRDTAFILEKVKLILKKGGYFTFIRYVFALENKDVFQELSGFEVVWRKIVARNLPPTEVVRMRKR